MTRPIGFFGTAVGHHLVFSWQTSRRLADLRPLAAPEGVPALAVSKKGAKGRARSIPMPEQTPWFDGLPVAITVTDQDGTVIDMNACAREAFASYGGGKLVGRSVFECHPGPARGKTEELYRGQQPNHYTVRKHATHKIIHQVPWFRGGAFAGYVELSLVVPENLPHFDRDA